MKQSLISELVLFTSFGIVQLLQQLDTPKRYYIGELRYQILSLVSKTVLGLLMLTNVLVFSTVSEALSES